jgi:hypothetical protein
MNKKYFSYSEKLMVPNLWPSVYINPNFVKVIETSITMSKPIDINKATSINVWYWREKNSENIKQKARKGIRPHPAGFETHDIYSKHNMGSLD